MGRTIVLTLYLAAAGAQESAPADTYEWLGDCPAACCGYASEWTATHDTLAWPERFPPDVRTARGAPGFIIRAGESVRALTGALQMLERGRATMREDFSTDASYANLSSRHRRAITLLEDEDIVLLAPRGPDTWRIWHRGRVLDAHLYRFRRVDACGEDDANRCAGAIANEPVTRWWVMVANGRGQVGWVESNGQFAIPACG